MRTWLLREDHRGTVSGSTVHTVYIAPSHSSVSCGVMEVLTDNGEISAVVLSLDRGNPTSL